MRSIARGLLNSPSVSLKLCASTSSVFPEVCVSRTTLADERGTSVGRVFSSKRRGFSAGRVTCGRVRRDKTKDEEEQKRFRLTDRPATTEIGCRRCCPARVNSPKRNGPFCDTRRGSRHPPSRSPSRGGTVAADFPQRARTSRESGEIPTNSGPRIRPVGTRVKLRLARVGIFCAFFTHLHVLSAQGKCSSCVPAILSVARVSETPACSTSIRSRSYRVVVALVTSTCANEKSQRPRVSRGPARRPARKSSSRARDSQLRVPRTCFLLRYLRPRGNV